MTEWLSLIGIIACIAVIVGLCLQLLSDIWGEL